MEQINKKVQAKKSGGSKRQYDDMGNPLPEVSSAMGAIDAALDAAEKQKQKQAAAAAKPKPKSYCGC